MDPRRKSDARYQAAEDRSRYEIGDHLAILVYIAPLLAIGYGVAWLLS